jgi:hypothetical protein
VAPKQKKVRNNRSRSDLRSDSQPVHARSIAIAPESPFVPQHSTLQIAVIAVIILVAADLVLMIGISAARRCVLDPVVLPRAMAGMAGAAADDQVHLLLFAVRDRGDVSAAGIGASMETYYRPMIFKSWI